MHWCLHSENSCTSLARGLKRCELTCSCGNSKCKSCHAEKLHHRLLHYMGTTCEQNHFFLLPPQGINSVCESCALKQKSNRQGRVKPDTHCFSCASVHRENRHRRVWKQDVRTGLRSPTARALYSLFTPGEELLYLQPGVSG